MKPLLKISNLSVNFKVRKSVFAAVKDFNLTIHENEIVGLVGESGSGKSVTAMSIMRLLPEPKAFYGTKSSILFDDHEILQADKNSLRDIRGNKISMIFFINFIIGRGRKIRCLFIVRFDVSSGH